MAFKQQLILFSQYCVSCRIPGVLVAKDISENVRTVCESHFTLDFLKHFISKSQTNLTTLGKCPKTQWTPLAHGI